MALKACAALLTMATTASGMVEPGSAHSAFVAPASRFVFAGQLPGRRWICAAPTRSATLPRRGRVMMAADRTGFNLGDRVVAKGLVGTLTSYNRSWWTVQLDASGGIVKLRSKDLAPAWAYRISSKPAEPGAAPGITTTTDALVPASKKQVTAAKQRQRDKAARKNKYKYKTTRRLRVAGDAEQAKHRNPSVAETPEPIVAPPKRAA